MFFARLFVYLYTAKLFADALYRSEMESICECTRYRAVQFLEAFVKEGKLRKAGRQNGRYYIPVEGCFGK